MICDGMLRLPDQFEVSADEIEQARSLAIHGLQEFLKKHGPRARADYVAQITRMYQTANDQLALWRKTDPAADKLLRDQGLDLVLTPPTDVFATFGSDSGILSSYVYIYENSRAAYLRAPSNPGGAESPWVPETPGLKDALLQLIDKLFEAALF